LRLRILRARQVLSLVGATVIMMVLADTITRIGVGNGYSIILAFGLLTTSAQNVGNMLMTWSDNEGACRFSSLRWP
jgi:preprotein translocase subunit SecY